MMDGSISKNLLDSNSVLNELTDRFCMSANRAKKGAILFGKSSARLGKRS